MLIVILSAETSPILWMNINKHTQMAPSPGTSTSHSVYTFTQPERVMSSHLLVNVFISCCSLFEKKIYSKSHSLASASYFIEHFLSYIGYHCIIVLSAATQYQESHLQLHQWVGRHINCAVWEGNWFELSSISLCQFLCCCSSLYYRDKCAFLIHHFSP